MCSCTHAESDHVTTAIDRTGQAWGVTIVRVTVCRKCPPMNADHGYSDPARWERSTFTRTPHDPPVKHFGVQYDGVSADGWHVTLRDDEGKLESLAGPFASWGEAMSDLAERLKR
jgi:hypothetical protein